MIITGRREDTTPTCSASRSRAKADAAARSLPVWIPGSYLVREFARHLPICRP
jgi:predicted metalloprotease with PDZ domain